MGTISVEVDIDIDEALEGAKTADLCRHLISRMKTLQVSKQLSVDRKNEIRDELIDLINELKLFPPKAPLPIIVTLDDQLKLEHIQRVWENYTSDQIIKALPL